jgi:hypothetical protein
MMDIDNNYLLFDWLCNMIDNDVLMYPMTLGRYIDDNRNLDVNIRDSYLYIFCKSKKERIWRITKVKWRNLHYHFDCNNFHWDINLNMIFRFHQIENLLNMIYNHLQMVLYKSCKSDDMVNIVDYKYNNHLDILQYIDHWINIMN